jgi:uncharacterized protein YndB with AHSA1/START domain
MTATLTSGDGRSMLSFERRLAHPPERVWRAITDPGELAAWFPGAVTYEPRVGAPMAFDFGGAHDLHTLPGEVLKWDPPRVFAFVWIADVLRFELRPDGDGTHLLFTHSFAHEPGKPARDAAGWEACLARFDALLAGTDPAADSSWANHADAYVERFGAVSVDGRPLVLTGPLADHDGHAAVLVRDADGDGVLVVREPGAPFIDGAVVQLRDGTVAEPGPVRLSGTLADPQAAAVAAPGRLPQPAQAARR